jgi:acetoacetate decarboxylase
VSERSGGTAAAPGSGTPLTASGRSIAYGPPPWNMRGRTLALWFRLVDPDEARRHVPSLLRMDPDPVLRARFWDMAHDAVPAYAPGATAPATAWTPFREAVVAFPVWHDGVEADYPTYMYADEFAYTAFGREVMGWPVRDGRIEVDPEPAGGPAAGFHVAGRLERGGRTVMQARLTLTGTRHASDDTNVPRWLASKVIADVGTPRAAVAQLVATGPERIHHRDIWEATGALSFGEGATDELHCLAPREIVAAQYWANVDLTIGWGTVLQELGDGVWDG